MKLFISLLLTFVSYEVIPFFMVIILKKHYDEKSVKKMALWNSIIVGLIFLLLTAATQDNNNLQWKPYPAFLYYFFNSIAWVTRKRKNQKLHDELLANHSIDEEMWGHEFKKGDFTNNKCNSKKELNRCVFGWCFIAFQSLATYCYFLTSNLNLFCSPYTGDKICQLIGFHLCLIVGIINLIIYKDGIKESFSSKITVVAITIIAIFSLFNLNFSLKNFKYSKNENENYNISIFKNDNSTNKVIDAELIYYCINGNLEGTKCVNVSSKYAYENEECPSGYTSSGFKCKKIGTWTDYSKCNSFNYTYDSLDDMCYPEITPIKKYSCISGQLVGDKCIEKNYTMALSKYTCPNGYKLMNNKCKKK